MSRFLLVIAVFIVVYLIMRNHARRRDASTWRDSASGQSAGRPQSPKPGEDMVRCGVCGVHLPKSESVTSRGDFFCGNEHLQLADRNRGKR